MWLHTPAALFDVAGAPDRLTAVQAQGDNYLTSTIPASWLRVGPLPRLFYLSLAQNQLVGTIPTPEPYCGLCGFKASALLRTKQTDSEFHVNAVSTKLLLRCAVNVDIAKGLIRGLWILQRVCMRPLGAQVVHCSGIPHCVTWQALLAVACVKNVWQESCDTGIVVMSHRCKEGPVPLHLRLAWPGTIANPAHDLLTIPAMYFCINDAKPQGLPWQVTPRLSTC